LKTLLTYIIITSSFFSIGQENNNFLFPLGNLQNESHEADSLKNGLTVDTFPNGNTKHIAFYVNGNAFGMVYNYFEHSKIESYGKMYNGKKEGLWLEFFYMNGKLKKKVDYSNKEERFKYELNYYESGKIWHATFNTLDLYTHYEYYLKENGDTQYVHKAVDSLNKIYTYSEFHAPGKPNVIGYKTYSLGIGWENIGTWNWYTKEGLFIRKKVYSSVIYGKD
jgi:hypothetical protein